MSDKSKKTKQPKKKPSTRRRHTGVAVSPSLQELLNRAAAFSQQLFEEQMAEAGFRPRRRSRRTAPRREEG